MKTTNYIGWLLVIPILFASCSKDFLDAKPDKQLTTLSRVSDLWALLDNTYKMNTNISGLPELAEVGTDDYFLSDNTWNALQVFQLTQKNAYIFSKQIFEGERSNWSWNFAYERVFYANVVLDALPTLADTLESATLKGTALFHRAFNFFWIAQLFAATYSNATLQQPGIPLRLNSDLNKPTMRSTVKQTYTQIISDLQQAMPLLPASIDFKTRVSKAAAHALLARTYLLMQDYQDCRLQCDSSLALSSTLMDFNLISPGPAYPFAAYNDEVLFHEQDLTGIFVNSRARVDTALYASYAVNDLRSSLYFKLRGAYYSFNGSYTGASAVFGGLATDEVWLMRAECFARLGDAAKAMDDLNVLLANRYTGYTPQNATDAAEALSMVLQERQKELCFRGTRWMDLRRLNNDTSTSISVKRIIGGQEYLLLPGSNLYVYPIPDDIVRVTGIEQNNR